MRLSQALLPLAISLFFLTSCGESGPDSTVPGDHVQDIEAGNQDSSPAAKALPFDPNANYLERMYATSSGKYGPENVLDADPNTSWEAMPGAGLNEGIMLYFEKPVFVEKLRIKATKSNTSIKKVSIYGNGAQMGSTAPGQKMEIGKAISALFIRIEEMNGKQVDQYFIHEGEGAVSNYPQDQIASISEIELFGKGGLPLKVRPLHLIKGKVVASSTLSPAEAYSPDFLFDSRLEFGWADGQKGSGIGEKLTFSFDRAVRIEKIKLWNGYQRSDKHFSSNERAQEISFGKTETEGASYTLPDEKTGTEIVLASALEGKTFTMAVLSVYPGKAYQDLVLSELRFFDGKRWFAMQTTGDKRRASELRDRLKGTVLENITDRNIEDEWKTDFGQYSRKRSLILRSNGSFVLYLTNRERTGVSVNKITQVADGNWEIITANNQSAKVKIFGKIHRIKDKFNLYKGKSKSDNTRIFHEFISVKQEMVFGSKLLDSLRLKLRDQDLVACDKYVSAKIDLKYMTGDNFMKEYLYNECMPCMLREDAARALGRAEKALKKSSGNKYDFLIWDAYRPYSVQKLMWEKIKDPKYVADPYNGGSSHNKGAAIDISLVLKGSKTAESIPMGTPFDHFGEAAHHAYQSLDKEALNNRKMLKNAMESAGFKALPTEWWHYSLGGTYPILDVDHECDY